MAGYVIQATGKDILRIGKQSETKNSLQLVHTILEINATVDSRVDGPKFLSPTQLVVLAFSVQDFN